MKHFFSLPHGLLLGSFLALGQLAAHAQGVGVGTTTPDASALLDLTSTAKGTLLPRMSSAQRAAIATPATGLLVFQTDGTAPGFYYNAGTSGTPNWVLLGAGDNLGNHTATQTLNLAANALTGTGADLGATVGLGVRADGGLNIGQNTNGNLFLGYQSGNASLTGTNNLLIGYQSGTALTSGSYNVFSGNFSGLSNTSGSNNLFSGYQSGRSNTTGSYNVFTGYQSGYANTTGHDNLFSGHFSGLNNTTGNYNVFTGIASGWSNTTGSFNVFSGYQSGYSNTTGNDNQFSGYYSGYANTLGIRNLFSGSSSGRNNTTGSNNVFSGYNSGYNNTTGGSNLFSGTYSGYANTTGTDNLFSGYNSGSHNTTGINNQFSGSYSGYNNTTGTNNLFSGYNSGYWNTSGSNNLFSGYYSGYANSSGNDNLFSGYYSGNNNTTGTNNLFSGTNSGYRNTSGSNNLFSGTRSGYSNTTGYANLFSGSNSGQTNSTGYSNLFSGTNSGQANTTGYNNVLSGTSSGYSNTTGYNNLFSGTNSGSNNTTGFNNTALGYQAGPTTAALTNATALGAYAQVSQSNSLVLGGTGSNAVSVGIGTNTPMGGLHIDTPESSSTSALGVLLSGGTNGNPSIELRGNGKTPYIDFAETNGVDYTTRLISRNGTLNVDRGAGTASSGPLLSVAGQVFSNSGGFRFPDNTVQTTAAGAAPAAMTATNGLTQTGSAFGLGGTLGRATTIAQAGNAFSLTGGNVGIGTDAPSGVLDVQGTEVTALVLDQQQLSTNAGGGGNDNYQSFTAGVTGNLVRIDLYVSSPTGADGAAGTLSVYAGNGLSGTMLTSQPITYNNVYNTFQVYNLTTPVAIVAGQQYTFRFQATTITVGFVSFASGTNPYPGGQTNASANDDYAFKTYTGTQTSTHALTVLTGGVGIGTATPTQKLEVSGQVFSNSGGFRFPDNTVQTTAATSSGGTTGPTGPQGPAGPTGATGPSGSGTSVVAANGLSTSTTSNVTKVVLGGGGSDLTAATSINQAGYTFGLTGGSVGIGTATPSSSETLDVNGSLRVGTSTTPGAVHTPTTGTRNMLAVAYGSLNNDVYNNYALTSGNYTVTHPSTGVCRLTFPASSGLSNVNFQASAISITSSSGPCFIIYMGGTGYIDVVTYGAFGSTAGQRIDGVYFSIVVFAP